MRPLVVADIGINHQGSVGLAMTMATMADSFGADYVKLQMHTPEHTYTTTYLNRERASIYGRTVRDEKRALEFDDAKLDQFAAHCERAGIEWFASPFTAHDAKRLKRYAVPFVKIPSQCVNNRELVAELATWATPKILSTGMSTSVQIAEAAATLGEGLQFILHCVSEYPTPDEHVNLAAVTRLKDLYPDKRIGFSSHSEKIIYPVLAAAMGAEMVEFHITMDRNMPGPDHYSSIGPAGFDRLMKHLLSLEVGYGSGLIQPSDIALVKGGHYTWRAT